MNFFSQQQPAEESAYVRVYSEAKRLVGLEIENARLLATEKLTLLFGRLALVAVCFIVGTTALIFLSMSVADFLLQGLPARWTYLIIAAFYILIIAIAAAFRRQLIIDPIARFVSRVFLDPPTPEIKETAIVRTSNTVSEEE